MALLYVFWHGPRPGVDEERYETALAGFLGELTQGAHEAALALTAVSAAVAAVPWIDAPGPVWQDAYRVDDMAALERLEALAVDAHTRPSHSAAAALAGHGTAGLYRSLGRETPVAAGWSCWLDRPAATTRPQFEGGLLEEASRLGASVWRRVMTLSPAPEFLVRVPKAPVPPVWPPALATAGWMAAERAVVARPAAGGGDRHGQAG